MYEEASQRLLTLVESLKLRHLFSLGWRGFLGASFYLVIPVTMMALGPKLDDQEVGGLFALVGGLLLSIVVAVSYTHLTLPTKRIV